MGKISIMHKYTTFTETAFTTLWDAGMSSEKVMKDAYITHVQSMPFTTIETDGYTFSIGGTLAFTECYTKKGLQHGIKKLHGINDGRIEYQYNQWVSCKMCGGVSTALCHRLPRSLGGTPTHCNIDYDCSTCNGKHSNQIVNNCVRRWLKSQHVQLTYDVKALLLY